MSFLYREHRGMLTDSMKTVVELESKDDLTKLIHSHYNGCGEDTIGDIKIEWYAFDDRIGWDTHIVTMKGRAAGFTNKAV